MYIYVYAYIIYVYICVYIYIYILYIYMCVCVCVCMVYTVLMHFALLVIPIIKALQQLDHFRTNVYGIFCTSTLKSLFIIFLGLKTKIWNVMDIWINLENSNFFLLLPNRMPLFHFLQRSHCDTTAVDDG